MNKCILLRNMLLPNTGSLIKYDTPVNVCVNEKQFNVCFFVSSEMD